MKRLMFSTATLLLPAVLTAGCVNFDDLGKAYDTPAGQDSRFAYIDATAGGAGAGEDDPRNKFTYYNLVREETVELSDSEAAGSLDWHMALKRFNILLNGGTSGPGTVAGFYTGNNASLADEEVFALTREAGRADFDAVTVADIPPEDAFRSDGLISQITDWYAYDADEGVYVAEPAEAYQIRTGDGMGFAKFHVVGLTDSTQGAAGRVEFEWALSDGGPYGADRLDAVEVFPGETVCFDFDQGAESDCESSGWDLKARGWDLNTNAGDTGPGSGGTIPLEAYESTLTPAYSPFYLEDLNLSVFMDDLWYLYSEQDHVLYPTYYVYMVRTPEAVFKVQIVSYYNEGVSGYFIVLFEPL